MALFSELPDRLQVERAVETLAPAPSHGADPREDLVLMEFEEVAGGSTAWINLLLALNSADTEIGPVDDLAAKGETRSVSAYWDWAWNTYCLAMSELGAEGTENKRLSYAYDLSELDECSWCGNKAVEDDLVRCVHDLAYHAGCLEQAKADPDAPEC